MALDAMVVVSYLTATLLTRLAIRLRCWGRLLMSCARGFGIVSAVSGISYEAILWVGITVMKWVEQLGFS